MGFFIKRQIMEISNHSLIGGGRIPYIDVLNVLACFSVVALHQNGLVFSYQNTIDWKLAIVTEVFFYWAVPVFFMITGATLIGYEDRYSNKFFFKKRIKRTLVPFLFFSTLGCFTINRGIPNDSLWESIVKIFDARYLTLYWFFVTLFWIYLFMPVLTKFRQLRQNEQKYLLFVMFFLSALPLVGVLLGHSFRCSSNELLGPILYVLLGYYLSVYNISHKGRILIYILCILSFILRGYDIFINSTKSGVFSSVLTDYYYPTSIVQAIGVFLFIKNTSLPNIVYRIAGKLSFYSLGIYLVHIFVIGIEHSFFDMLNINSRSYPMIYLLTFVTYIISLIIVFIIKRIPVLRILIP